MTTVLCGFCGTKITGEPVVLVRVDAPPIEAVNVPMERELAHREFFYKDFCGACGFHSEQQAGATTFEELLKSAAGADAVRQERAAQADAARSALKAATRKHAAATEALKAAHAAIRERLATRGHHSIIAPDGTLSIYRLSPDAPQGWSSFHPVAGA